MNNESSHKALASISLCVSSLSAIISIVAIALNAPRYSKLGFDYTAVIVAAFALIVTALIGLQVAQYIFSGDRMQRIAEDIAKETVTLITDDLKHIMDALDCLASARVNAVFNASERSIVFYLDSLRHYSKIKDSNLRQEYVSDLLEELSHHVQTWKKENCLYKNSKWTPAAVSLLDTFDTPLSVGIKEALLDSPEWNPNEKHCISTISPL